MEGRTAKGRGPEEMERGSQSPRKGGARERCEGADSSPSLRVRRNRVVFRASARDPHRAERADIVLATTTPTATPVRRPARKPRLVPAHSN
eukprot:2924692-Rhodomonas_salina.2